MDGGIRVKSCRQRRRRRQWRRVAPKRPRMEDLPDEILVQLFLWLPLRDVGVLAGATRRGGTRCTPVGDPLQETAPAM